MAAREEIIELEESVCELAKKISEQRVELDQKEISLRYAREDLEEIRQRWLHLSNNSKHMRQRADIVDLDEYRRTQKLLETARGDFDDATAKVGRFTTIAKIIKKAIHQAEEKKNHQISILNKYGLLIPMVWK